MVNCVSHSLYQVKLLFILPCDIVSICDWIPAMNVPTVINRSTCVVKAMIPYWCHLLNPLQCRWRGEGLLSLQTWMCTVCVLCTVCGPRHLRCSVGPTKIDLTWNKHISLLNHIVIVSKWYEAASSGDYCCPNLHLKNLENLLLYKVTKQWSRCENRQDVLLLNTLYYTSGQWQSGLFTERQLWTSHCGSSGWSVKQRDMQSQQLITALCVCLKTNILDS
jgi:hypothetical protein